MTRFFAFCGFSRPGLHIWRDTGLRLFLEPLVDSGLGAGWFLFECQLGTGLGDIRCLLFQWKEDRSEPIEWEKGAHTHTIPAALNGELPGTIWIFHGAARAATEDPFAVQVQRTRVHLVTASKYMNAELYLWNSPDMPSQTLFLSGHDESGPYWDLDLRGRSRSWFQFKFRRRAEAEWRYEADVSNRVWISQDGAEIWTHSEAWPTLRTRPVKRQLTAHFRQEIDPAHPARMHLWQEGSDFVTDVIGEPQPNGWSTHRVLIYTGLPYRAQFFNPSLDEIWEHPDAIRDIVIDDETQVWTLEGDSRLFPTEPSLSSRVDVQIAAQAPGLELSPPLTIEARVNRARAPLPACNGLSFTTYTGAPTSFRVRGANGLEGGEPHRTIVNEAARVKRWVVLGRPPALPHDPGPVTFADPPFSIRRPGAYEEAGFIRLALHAPFAAQVQLRGEWMPEGALETLSSTRDGAYWWGQIAASDVDGGAYHSRRYHYVLNADPAQRAQDPAAGWVEGSHSAGHSRLVQTSAFAWSDQGWETPAWDSLRLFQVHPARFSARHPGETALDRLAWELEHGYLKKLSVNALQLMPVNEVGTTNSWGYDPAFFYAVEETYGGPDALKRLVNACHGRGIAVLLDVVFNHAGTSDNSLWPVAQGTFFDGDTAWGAMINFDHPQVIHFFEQNLAYLLSEYRVDGFRFDFTRVIIRGHEPGEAHVRKPGSGGGWEFLHKLRAAARKVNPRCIFIAEHLPNEWAVSNHGGPMDSQWCDNFHDRLKEACEGKGGALPALADALRITHTEAREWHNATNYAESHDEVGNENGRIANVAEFGRGWRMSKVAAAVTLLSRGIPMFFMGAESGEHRQFFNGSTEALDLEAYENEDGRKRIRAWFNVLLELRASENIKGPSPLWVAYAQDQQLAFVRGQAGEFYTLVNFGSWAGWKSLASLNLPAGAYRELWNSTWPAFAVENEDEHANGGRDAYLTRDRWLHVPDYGVVVLERR